MPTEIKLDDAIDGILTKITELLDFARSSHTLEVRSVVRGDAHRGTPDTPAVWVFCETATVETPRQAHAERWRLPITLVVVLKHDDPVIGQRKAQQLAAQARHVINRDRTLGLIYVHDLQPARFYFTPPRAPIGLHAAACTCEAVFTVFEPV